MHPERRKQEGAGKGEHCRREIGREDKCKDRNLRGRASRDQRRSLGSRLEELGADTLA